MTEATSTYLYIGGMRSNTPCTSTPFRGLPEIPGAMFPVDEDFRISNHLKALANFLGRAGFHYKDYFDLYLNFGNLVDCYTFDFQDLDLAESDDFQDVDFEMGLVDYMDFQLDFM